MSQRAYQQSTEGTTTNATDFDDTKSVSAAHHAQVATNTNPPTGTTAKGPQVVVLATSTSTTALSKTFDLFDPAKLYEVTLDQAFFDELASPTGKGLLDLAKEVGPGTGDYFHVGSTELKGTKPQSATFTLHSQLQGAARLSTNHVKVQASGNGMLNIARLASAYITAKQTGAFAKNPASLALACEINFGAKAAAANEDARKEMVLSTIPPSFNPTANGMCCRLLEALIAGCGLQGEVYRPDARDKADNDHDAAVIDGVIKRSGADSAQAFADQAELGVNGNWKDRPLGQRTFVTTPLTGIADGLMTSIRKLAKATAGDVDPDAVHAAAFGKRTAVKSRTQSGKVSLDTGIKDLILAEAKAQVQAIRDQIVAAQAAGIAAELPAAFAQYLPATQARWTAAVDDAIAQIGWFRWYEMYFEKNNYLKGGPSSPTVVASREGNVEGATKNEIRQHAVEPDVDAGAGGN